jgi:ribulose-5-phosphate 4-epimerase/fuculose-1-phosphate aldolase
MLLNDSLRGRNLLRRSTLVVALTLLAAAVPILAQQAPSSAGPVDPALMEDLVAASRILARQGVVDAFGHVSVRHNLDPNRYLVARSLAPALVTADDIVEYDLDSNPVNLNGRGQFSERFIHGEIYKARPDVIAVVHNHSPSVVAFSISSRPLRPVYHMPAFIGEMLKVFDIREAVGITDVLVRDAQRGRALVEVLGDEPAVLMRGHGVAIVGDSLPLAVGRSVYLELNARIQAQAIALGGDITYLDPGESRMLMEGGEHRGFLRAWELWKQEVSGQ